MLEARSPPAFHSSAGSGHTLYGSAPAASSTSSGSGSGPALASSASSSLRNAAVGSLILPGSATQSVSGATLSLHPSSALSPTPPSELHHSHSIYSQQPVCTFGASESSATAATSTPSRVDTKSLSAAAVAAAASRQSPHTLLANVSLGAPKADAAMLPIAAPHARPLAPYSLAHTPGNMAPAYSSTTRSSGGHAGVARVPSQSQLQMNQSRFTAQLAPTHYLSPQVAHIEANRNNTAHANTSYSTSSSVVSLVAPVGFPPTAHTGAGAGALGGGFSSGDMARRVELLSQAASATLHPAAATSTPRLQTLVVASPAQQQQQQQRQQQQQKLNATASPVCNSTTCICACHMKNNNADNFNFSATSATPDSALVVFDNGAANGTLPRSITSAADSTSALISESDANLSAAAAVAALTALRRDHRDLLARLEQLQLLSSQQATLILSHQSAYATLQQQLLLSRVSSSSSAAASAAASRRSALSALDSARAELGGLTSALAAVTTERDSLQGVLAAAERMSVAMHLSRALAEQELSAALQREAALESKCAKLTRAAKLNDAAEERAGRDRERVLALADRVAVLQTQVEKGAAKLMAARKEAAAASARVQTLEREKEAEILLRGLDTGLKGLNTNAGASNAASESGLIVNVSADSDAAPATGVVVTVSTPRVNRVTVSNSNNSGTAAARQASPNRGVKSNNKK